MSEHLLQAVGLSREDVASMTMRMKPATDIIAEIRLPEPRRSTVVKDAILAYLRRHNCEWLDSGKVAAGVGIQATLAGNIMSALARSASSIEKRIGPERRPEYRWIGGGR
jgi:hypothetical protein